MSAFSTKSRVKLDRRRCAKKVTDIIIALNEMCALLWVLETV